MRKTLVVALREYLAAIRSKAFIITIVMMPVFMAGGFIADRITKGTVDTRDRKLAVLDRTGVLYESLERAAEVRNKYAIFEDGKGADPENREQSDSRFLLERVDPRGKEPEALLLELSERVRRGELFAYVDIGKEALVAREIDSSRGGGDTDSRPAPVCYYSNAPGYRDSRRWLETAINTAVQTWRFTQSGLDGQKIGRALQPVALDNLALLARDSVTGDVVPAQKVDEFKSLAIPALMMMLLLAVVMTGAAPLVQSVLEEKTGRIAELLMSAVSPFEWMMGKLLGVVGVSLTIVAVYLAGGCAVALHYGVFDALPLHLLGWFCVYQVLAVLMYGSVFVAVGSACNDHREAQSTITPVMLLIVLPMMFWIQVAKEPTTTFALLMSLFPPATPLLMLIRQAIPPGIPSWQPLLGIVLVVATTVVCIFAASRIFRVGMLIQGKGAKFSEMARWVFRG